MRRGHPSVGGWRGENQRHFRSGSGGGPHFRPPRPFSLLDSPRYPPPGPRPHRPCQPFIGHGPDDYDSHSKYDRNKYRLNNWSNSHPRPQDRNHHAQHQYSKHNNDPPYKDQSNFYKNKQEGSNINSMGDVDHRQLFQRQISPWKNDTNDNRQFERSNYQPRKHRYSEGEIGNTSDYKGHRPPALDHYGDPVATINESDTFSRSVDDTVDIVRKRLLNRNEPVTPGEAQMDVDQREGSEPMTSTYTMQQEQPARKRIQRQKQSVSTNCDKMKNKIVNQLFKMDKVKIHKLMDNPSSSTKFEYAISSLITESQNSFHRHMRSVAEKSLCSSSSDFIQNDNNTIYEDTFMKQMQCILDPQDTILLEDIKPLVMAELNKVLQLDDYDPRYGYNDNPDMYGNKDVQNHEQYPSDYYDNYPQNYHEGEESFYNHDQTYNETTSPNISAESQTNYYPNHDDSGPRQAETDNNKDTSTSKNLINVVTHEAAKPWSDSFVVKKETSLDERIEQLRRHSYESRRLARLSSDKPSEEIFNQSDKNLPLFETNAENVSDEDEDPFAELDNQYHVAVDPNFIEPDDLKIEQQPRTPVPPNLSDDTVTPEKRSIKKEIENQFQAYVNSPIKLGCKDVKGKHMSYTKLDKIVKKEKQFNHERRHSISTPSKSDCSKQNMNISQDSSTDINQLETDIERQMSSLHDTAKSSVPSVARKRSVDQKPSHRKEKRKKSESSESESNKQILNKNIIINVTDCTSGTTEKTCEKSAKSIFNLYFSKDNRNKDTKVMESKIPETPEKKYSDKYVKRKEIPKKTESETKKKNNSSHSNVSPKDSLKSDSKTKFQTFDMFSEQPKKANVYQAHRNTAVPVADVSKTVDEKQCKTTKVLKKHVSTQVCKKVCIKETQTIPKRNVMRAAQTDPVKFLKSSPKATDAFERMKEIDLEIQALLQEKFKLYNSLESKSTCPKGMENLGMTVVNMPMEQPSNISETVAEDAIVENFTSIPVEELEQLAFETIDGEPVTPNTQTKSQRQRVTATERKSSESPTLKRSKRQKTKALNISILEQIIDDDRPLEDIISLDDLEATPTKAALKVKPKKKKKPVNKKVGKKKVAKNVSFLEEDHVGLNQQCTLKECFVVLERIDLCNYLKPNPNLVIEEVIETPDEEVTVTAYTAPERPFFPPPSTCSIVEEALNQIEGLQFDMLDVSEDIVIGEGYEKEEILKESDCKVNEVVAEEVVLDNCLSSDSKTPLESAQSETQCKIYDFSADENLKRDSTLVSGNADSVLAIECIGNNFVAACLDGNVYHFTGDGTLLSTLRGSNLAVTCLTLVKEKYGTTVYTGSLDSRIRYYDLETGMEKGPECNVLSPIQTMDRAWDTIFVGTRTGFVLQFECKNNMLIPVSTVKFSDQSILALRAMKEGPRKVLLVAARSENVTIKDAQSGLLLRTLEGPKMTVYTLLYVEGRVYCGTSSHQIQIFDYTSGSHVGTLVGGKGAVAVVSCGGLVFAGCYDGAVYVFRQHDSAPCALFRGPNNMLLSLAVHDTKIIAGYKDRSLYIWKIPLNILKEMIL